MRRGTEMELFGLMDNFGMIEVSSTEVVSSKGGAGIGGSASAEAAG